MLLSDHSDVLAQPPPGAWYIPTSSGFTIGASTRSAAALVAAPVTFIWSRSVVNLFIRPLWNGQLRIIPADVMIPYLLVSVFLIGLCLMTIGGKVELERNGDDSKVFVGFRKIGWSRHFQWSGIEEICLLQQGRGRVIVIEGARRIAFGSGLSSVRRDFLLQGLKRLRMGGSIILVK